MEPNFLTFKGNCFEGTHFISTDLFLDVFANHGCVIIENLLHQKDLISIQDYYESRLHEFSPAGIGKAQHKSVQPEIRSDKNLWVDNLDPNLNAYFDKIEVFKNIFRSKFFLPVYEHETQMAHYSPGSFYAKHKDRHQRSQSRLVTSVFYLNSNWDSAYGGQLVVYPFDQTKHNVTNETSSKIISKSINETIVVDPLANRLVLFLSELEHEVLVTTSSRKSLTTWFRCLPD